MRLDSQFGNALDVVARDAAVPLSREDPRLAFIGVESPGDEELGGGHPHARAGVE